MNTDNKRGLSVPSLWPPLAGHSFDIRTIAKREGDRSPCQELETFHIGGVAVAAPYAGNFCLSDRHTCSYLPSILS